ncbi:hypothetical protein [Flavobacterium humi]|uniref:Lipoprotein n=1 Tax=Flavobacterium humi TaxID=2562683 RepID=A0A4Z0LCB1_9FLAO|nr:hypothetical protein [Flavobacterium humi]TGD59514.1 hypothetical protein E4635_00845 [Flavobacterium humi]
MKKIVLFLLFPLLMVGCKPNDDKPKPNEGKPADASEIQEGKCGENLIVIDSSKTDSNWRSQNERFFCELKLPTRKDNHTHNYYIIDLDKVNVLNRDEVGKWLKKNTKFICYEESYQYIEKQHDIEITPVLTQQISNLNKATITFKDLKTEISKISNFDTLYYDTYVQFSLESGKVKVTPFADFDYTKNLYSIPLLKSILYNNRTISDQSYLEFYDVSTDSGKQIIVFGIRDATNLVLFYDISVNPFYFNFFTK